MRRLPRQTTIRRPTANRLKKTRCRFGVPRRRMDLRTIRSTSSRSNSRLRRCQRRTSSGNRQCSQSALECSQKSRVIWSKPCWAEAPRIRQTPPHPQQTLPGQFQNGVVLRRRPHGLAVFDDPPDFFIPAFGGARPKPRQDHIHRQIRHPRISQQRLRLFQSRRTKRPVPGPEFVVFHFQDFPQGTGQFFVGDFSRTPSFEFLKSDCRLPANARPAPAGVADDWPGEGREISRPRAATGSR